MKFQDLLLMSSSSLWKRKIRTILTVLGVVIGTASIVVMISLGLGLNKATLEEIEKNGGLTTITVYEPDTFQYYEDGSSSMSTSIAGTEDSSKDAEKKRLTDELVEQLKQMEHVVTVSPVLEISAMARSGNYSNYLNIKGMSVEALEKMDIPLESGTLPKKDAEEFKLLYGSQLLENFYNEKTGQGFWETGITPDIDLIHDAIFVIFDIDAYWQSQSGGTDGKPVAPPKKYPINGSGVISKEATNWEYSYNSYCDIEALKVQLKRIFKNKPIPGQPTMKSGKPYKELYYNSIYVNVDNIDYMKETEENIKALGYQVESNMAWVASQQKQYGMIQAILGGIGAVSLFVAAIGITNTMMMSIYERTKEIGIMKVIGCDMRNIQTMFLLEAGFIGLIGGVIGLLLSYGISSLINLIVANVGSMQANLSYIPPWLALLSIVFASFVGMTAGFFPSMRAMRLSPLAAIRNE